MQWLLYALAILHWLAVQQALKRSCDTKIFHWLSLIVSKSHTETYINLIEILFFQAEKLFIEKY